MADAAVVLTVILTFAGFVPSGVTVAGEAAHVARLGAPLQEIDTAWLNPSSGATLTE